MPGLPERRSFVAQSKQGGPTADGYTLSSAFVTGCVVFRTPVTRGFLGFRISYFVPASTAASVVGSNVALWSTRRPLPKESRR
jgi:hypothetical protein